MGRGPTVRRGKFLAHLSVGVLLPGHPGDGRPRPESAHGARDELPGLRTEHRRLRSICTQRSRARRVLLISTLVALSTTWQNLRRVIADGFSKLCLSVYYRQRTQFTEY